MKTKTMRKTIYIVCALVTLLLAGCGKSGKDNKPAFEEQLAGAWQLSELDGAGPENFDLYMELGSDDKFSVYYRVDQAGYQLYTGDYTASATTLSGTYKSGSAWSNSYVPSLDAAKNILTLVSKATPTRTVVFVRISIPSEVKSGATAGDDRTMPAPTSKRVVGEWHLSEWSGIAPGDFDFDAYIALNEDRSFSIYQKVEQLKYQLYTGTYSVTNTILSGVYTSGSNWGSSYTASLDADNRTLTLVSSTGVTETSVYVRESIPSNVRSGVRAMSVRSEVFKPLL